MVSTRAALKEIDDNLDESIGIRDESNSQNSIPVAAPQDIGRQPLRTFGKVDINMVEPDPSQPRKEFTEESIQRFAQSIKQKGQLQPITVRWSPETKKWLIISGERRWRASKTVGMKTINCHFEQRDLKPGELLEQQLVENLLREDLKPIEQARAYSSLMELNNWNGKQVAESLHIAPSTVSRALALLDLPNDVQQQVDAGDLSARAAYEISKLPSESAQRKVAKTGSLPAVKAKAVVDQRRGKAKPKPRGFKQSFQTENGVKVLVTSSAKTNYHEIEAALTEAIEEVRHYIKNGRVTL